MAFSVPYFDWASCTKKIVVKKVDPEAIMLSKATVCSEGYDLSAVCDYTIPEGQTRFLATGLSIQCPSQVYAEIHGRSSMAAKGVIVHNGIIDQDYPGSIFVIAMNCCKEDYQVRKGDRIAQIIFKKKVEVTLIDENSRVIEPPVFLAVRRGGFGSSGI